MPFIGSSGGGGGGGSGTVTAITVAADNGAGGTITTTGTISILGGTNTTTNVTGTSVTINDNYVTKTITTTYTALTTDRVLFCDASGGGFTLTLPASVDGKVYVIKDKNTASPTQAITVAPSAGTLDGATNYVIDSLNQSLTVIGDGANYWII